MFNMADETTIISKESVESKTVVDPSKPKTSESHLFNISLRGLITLSVVWVAAYMSLAQIKIEEPFYSLLGMVVAYYFGQNSKQVPARTGVS